MTRPGCRSAAARLPLPFGPRLAARSRRARGAAGRLCGQAIGELPPQQRLCMELRVYQERSMQEIAAALRISPETVKAHLFQARQRLWGQAARHVRDDRILGGGGEAMGETLIRLSRFPPGAGRRDPPGAGRPPLCRTLDRLPPRRASPPRRTRLQEHLVRCRDCFDLAAGGGGVRRAGGKAGRRAQEVDDGCALAPLRPQLDPPGDAPAGGRLDGSPGGQVLAISDRPPPPPAADAGGEYTGWRRRRSFRLAASSRWRWSG